MRVLLPCIRTVYVALFTPPAQQTTLDDLVRRDADNGDVDGGRRLALGRDPDQ